MALKPVCRVGDQGEGICYLHSSPTNFTTTFTDQGGSQVIEADGLKITTVGTIGITTCGHHTIATTGSGSSICETGAIHRVGDVGVIVEGGGGTYTATTGSSFVSSE